MIKLDSLIIDESIIKVIKPYMEENIIHDGRYGVTVVTKDGDIFNILDITIEQAWNAIN